MNIDVKKYTVASKDLRVLVARYRKVSSIKPIIIKKVRTLWVRAFHVVTNIQIILEQDWG